jgi:hypothetical protein
MRFNFDLHSVIRWLAELVAAKALSIQYQQWGYRLVVLTVRLAAVVVPKRLRSTRRYEWLAEVESLQRATGKPELVWALSYMRAGVSDRRRTIWAAAVGRWQKRPAIVRIWWLSDNGERRDLQGSWETTAAEAQQVLDLLARMPEPKLDRRALTRRLYPHLTLEEGDKALVANTRVQRQLIDVMPAGVAVYLLFVLLVVPLAHLSQSNDLRTRWTGSLLRTATSPPRRPRRSPS